MRQGLIGILLLGAAASVAGQAKTYKARLSPVPIDVAMQATVAGAGTMTATRTGAKLALTGSFEGLKSPATRAQLHKGPVTGVRGPAVGDLEVAHATSGAITGTIDLTPALQEDLDKGRLYVQLHSEGAPDGNLWGWLLGQENRR
jgi:hypothetical protein